MIEASKPMKMHQTQERCNLNNKTGVISLKQHLSHYQTLPMSEDGEYDIWAMEESDAYLEYIDNEVLEDFMEWMMQKKSGKPQNLGCGVFANSKKMQKDVYKQQFEAFTISSSEGLEKGYDRFQKLLSQLEAHGTEVSTEDANHKFLRSLPPAWSNLAMTYEN
ncbi:hypothetical protein Tco_0323587 [Tanacetum coccineum]